MPEKKRLRARVTIPGAGEVWVSAYSRKELERKKKEAQEQFIYGERVQDKPFVSVINDWWENEKKPGIRAHSTLINWKATLRNHVLPFFPPLKLCRAITRQDLQHCLNAVAGMNTIVGTQVNACLCGACKLAMAEGYISRDPSLMIKKPQPMKVKPKGALSEEQEQKIIEAIPTATREEACVIALLYYTGMRRGEVIGLQWKDIDWDRKLIHVQRNIDLTTGRKHPDHIGTLKTESSNRYVPLLLPLENYLRPLRGMPHQYVTTGTTTSMTQNIFECRMNTILMKAGLARRKPDAKVKTSVYGIERDITSHWFRHHYTSSCMIAGLRPDHVKLIMGHSDFNTTLEVYTHIIKDGVLTHTLLADVIKSDVAKTLPEELLLSQIFH